VKTILILGGWHATTMWFFKTQGGKGNYRLWIGDCWEQSACRYSRYCERFFLLPNHSNELSYIDKIIEIYRTEGFDALIPIPHEEVILISKYRDRLLDAGVPVVITNYDTMQIAVDKEKLGHFCKEHGIRYPATFAGDKYTGRQILEAQGIPLIVKLKASTNQVDQMICHKPDEFLSYFEWVCRKHGRENVIAQQFINGYELDSMFTTGVFCNRDSKILGIFSTKKIRARPYSGGAGICTKTVDEPNVENICRKTVEAFFRWQAICNIEVKRDSVTGEYYLIEINPRAWGSPMFSITLSGVDLIDLWIRLTVGEELPSKIVLDRKGVYSTELFHDFMLLTDLLKDLPFKAKRQKAWESLLSYKFPYFSNADSVMLYEAIADMDIHDLVVFWKKIIRLKKRLIYAILPINKGRKEGEYK